MTDALAAPLGNLVIAFNDLEIAMGGALMHIVRNDDEFVGTVFISALGFSQKYALVKALAVKLDNTKKRDDLLALLETARHLNEERNRYVHAGYTSIMGDNDQVMFVLHQRLKDFSKESLFRMNDANEKRRRLRASPLRRRVLIQTDYVECSTLSVVPVAGIGKHGKWAQAHGTREALDRRFRLAEKGFYPPAEIPCLGQIGIEHKRSIDQGGAYFEIASNNH